MELPQPPKAKTVQTPPHRWRWLTGGAWITSAIALTASLLMFVALPSQQDMLMHELVAAHIRSLMPGHLMDVPSSDQHTVKPWFNGKASLSPPVPNLADQGFPLVGGRLDYVEDQTAAVLIYRRNQHVINLFVWKDPKALEQAPYVGERNGYSLETWTKAGLRFAAVSDVALADLKEFQHLWVKAATAGDAEKTAP
jgi:anti-sigma factor RsiW